MRLRPPLLDGLCAPDVALVETSGDGGVLTFNERQLVQAATAERRSEFTTVRSCARTAMTQLGVPPAEVLWVREGPSWARPPRWPPGVVGSLTHCRGYRAAALALLPRVSALGIDAEPDEPLPPEARDYVMPAAEDLPGTGGPAWDRLLFSALESLFKATYQFTGLWLAPRDCRIHFDIERSSFTARLLGAEHQRVLGSGPITGRWSQQRTSSLLATAVVLR